MTPTTSCWQQWPGSRKPSAKIEAVERAWVAYRDAYMEATYPAEEKQAEYGSRFPMDWNLLRARLTVRQVTALKEMLESYTETH